MPSSAGKKKQPGRRPLSYYEVQALFDAADALVERIRARRRNFFFNATPTTEIYTLSLHDALPISRSSASSSVNAPCQTSPAASVSSARIARSEEHTSELQSRVDLVCRLLPEK